MELTRTLYEEMWQVLYCDFEILQIYVEHKMLEIIESNLAS